MPPSSSSALPTVVLVGRPNVGKSTLFNRVTGKRRAIVAPRPGTTRDVLAHPAEWQGFQFSLVDTGGLFGASEDPLHELVVRHGRRALATADLLVFVVDGREGLVAADEEIAHELRRLHAPTIVAVNKTDDRAARERAVEFYQLGFPDVIDVAAEHGLGVGDLLDEVRRRLAAGSGDAAGRAETAETAEPDSEGAIVPADAPPLETCIAIVGRPNVGKSSLVNRFLREERVMVSDMPGTTRDTIDEVLQWRRRRFRIVDTAGIRRPGRVARKGGVEAISVVMARRAIAGADVAVLVIDATEGATDQDAAIAGEADRAGCGMVIAVNKWDLVKRPGGESDASFDEEVRRRLKFLEYAPLVRISALTGERTFRLLEIVEQVAEARRHRVGTAELNQFLESVTTAHRPPAEKGRDIRILYGAQTGIAPPTFVLFTNGPTRLHFSYERFLVNRLRDAFGFMGTPIRIHVRRRR